MANVEFDFSEIAKSVEKMTSAIEHLNNSIDKLSKSHSDIFRNVFGTPGTLKKYIESINSLSSESASAFQHLSVAISMLRRENIKSEAADFKGVKKTFRELSKISQEIASTGVTKEKQFDILNLLDLFKHVNSTMSKISSPSKLAFSSLDSFRSLYKRLVGVFSLIPELIKESKQIKKRQLKQFAESLTSIQVLMSNVVASGAKIVAAEDFRRVANSFKNFSQAIPEIINTVKTMPSVNTRVLIFWKKQRKEFTQFFESLNFIISGITNSIRNLNLVGDESRNISRLTKSLLDIGKAIPEILRSVQQMPDLAGWFRFFSKERRAFRRFFTSIAFIVNGLAKIKIAPGSAQALESIARFLKGIKSFDFRAHNLEGIDKFASTLVKSFSRFRHLKVPDFTSASKAFNALNLNTSNFNVKGANAMTIAKGVLIRDSVNFAIRNLTTFSSFLLGYRGNLLTAFFNIGDAIRKGSQQVANSSMMVLRQFSPTRIFRSQAFNAAAEFDQVSTQLKIFGNMTDEQLVKAQALSNQVGIDFPLSTNDALKATLDLAKAGRTLEETEFILPATASLTALSDSQDLDKITKFLINAGMNVRQVTDDITGGFQAVSDITDVIFRAANVSTASIDGLVDGMQAGILAGKAMNMTFEQTAAFLSIIEDAGIRGTEAGTAMRTFEAALRKQEGATIEEKMERVLSAGFDVGSFGDTRGIQVLRILRDAQMRGGIDGVVESMQGLMTAGEASEAMLDNLRGEIMRLQGTVETAMTVAFMPMLERFFRPIVKALRSATEAFIGMNDTLRQTLMNGALITVMGVALSAATTLVTARIIGLSGWFLHLIGGMGMAILRAPMLIISLGGIATSLSVLAIGITTVSAGFMFLSDAITQSFKAIEGNVGGAGDSFRRFSVAIRSAFNEVFRFFGRIKIAYRTVFSKDDEQALLERGETVSKFFDGLSETARNFATALRGISTENILGFIERTKSRFDVLRGILQDLRVGVLGALTGQEAEAQRFRVGLSKILHSITDFGQRVTKIDLSKALNLFQRGEVVKGLSAGVSSFLESLRNQIMKRQKELADIGGFIFNMINPLRRLETGFRFFGATDIANDLKKINDQLTAGVKGIIKTVINLLQGANFVEAIRAGFGLDAARIVKEFNNTISQLLDSIGITVSFNPLKGLVDTLKSFPTRAIQSLIDIFKGLGVAIHNALSGDRGAILNLGLLTGALAALVGPKILGKLSGAISTFARFAKAFAIFTVVEAVAKNLNTLLNRNFFEGLTSIIADIAVGFAKMLGLDDENLAKVESFFNDVGSAVMRFAASVERVIKDLIIGLEDTFPAIFAPSEMTKEYRKNRELIKEVQTLAFSPTGGEFAREGVAGQLRRIGVAEELIDMYTAELNDVIRTATSGEDLEVKPLRDFFDMINNELIASGFSNEQTKVFRNLRDAFEHRVTGDHLLGGIKDLTSGGRFSASIGLQSAVLAYGRELNEITTMSVMDGLETLFDISRFDSEMLRNNADAINMVLNRIQGETGLQNLTSEQLNQVVSVVRAGGRDLFNRWLPEMLNLGLGSTIAQFLTPEEIAPYVADIFEQASDLVDYDGYFAPAILRENLQKLFETEQELNVSVPEELIRKQIYRGLTSGGDDFTKEALKFADEVRGIDTGASTYDPLEAIKLLEQVSRAKTNQEQLELLAGKTIDQVVFEAIAATETSPEMRSHVKSVSGAISQVFAGELQKQAVASSVLYGGSSRFRGSASQQDNVLFEPVEISSSSRKGLLDVFNSVRKMSNKQISDNFQAIAMNLMDIGIFAEENSDILSLFLEELQKIQEENPELGNMADAFSLLSRNIAIAERTLADMGISIDDKEYNKKLTELLTTLGSLNDIGDIIIPVTVTAKTDGLTEGGLSPEEIARLLELEGLIENYTNMLSGVTTGIFDAEKTLEELIKEYHEAEKKFQEQTVKVQEDMAKASTEFAESEREKIDSFNKQRERALDDHLRNMRSIAEKDLRDAIAGRNASAALAALERQKEAKDQFNLSEQRAKEDFDQERQKALQQHQLRQQERQVELQQERQRLDALRQQRDAAIRLELMGLRTEYDILLQKRNAHMQANRSIEEESNRSMRRFVETIAQHLHNAINFIQQTPMAQAFGALAQTAMNTVMNMVSQAQARMATQAIQQMAQNISTNPKSLINSVSNPMPNLRPIIPVIPPISGFRASGGSLEKNRWYITGERGPEPIYMGDKQGYIATMNDVMRYQRHNRYSGASGGNISVNVDMSNMQINNIEHAREMVRELEVKVVGAVTGAIKRVTR